MNVSRAVAAVVAVLPVVTCAQVVEAAAVPDSSSAQQAVVTAGVASAAPRVIEVGRAHGRLIGSGAIDDRRLTVVKYYDSSGRYQICVADYHPFAELSHWDWSVTWRLPGEQDVYDELYAVPGGLVCTPWRARHGSPDIRYTTHPDERDWFVDRVPWT